MLTDDAYNRYKLLLKTYPNIEQHVSQYHIASYLGIRAESLSRIKSLNIGQRVYVFSMPTFAAKKI